MKETYKVPEAYLPEFEKRMKKLNRKADKLRLEPAVYKIGSHEWRRIGKGIIKILDMEVSSPAPLCIQGWKFIGAVEHFASPEANLIFTAHGYELPETYRNADPSCEHCLKNRRRKKTFILLHEDGRMKQVGRTCLGDFFEGVTANDIAAQAEHGFAGEKENLSEWSDEESWNSLPRMYAPTMILMVTMDIIRRFGWTSKTETMDDPTKEATADRVRSALSKMDLPDHNPKDKETAKKIIDWLQKITGNKSEYMYNLAILSARPYIGAEHFGIVVSGVTAFRRHEAKLEADKRAKEESKSRHIGEIKERITFRGHVVFTTSFEGSFGPVFIWKFQDEDGNNFTWFASSDLEDIEIGNEVTVTGSVKKHGEYNGILETVITRAKVKLTKPDNQLSIV